MHRLLVLSSLAALAAGCTLNVEALSQEKHARYDGDFTALRIHLGSLEEPIQIDGWDEAALEASAGLVALVTPGDTHALDDARLDLVRRQSRLELAVRGVSDQQEAFYLEWLRVALPRATDLELATDDADIEIGGMSGRVRAESDTGDIRVATSGSLALETETGDIQATGSGGSIVTDTGDISMRLTDAGFDDLRIVTDTGDVRLTLPAGAGCVLDLETDTGDVRLNAGGFFTRTDGGLYVTIGGGGPLVRIRTDTGDIRITER